MSLKVNRRWAAHINIEFARVGAHEQIVSEARARSVAILRRDDGILRPGSLALTALVQLPDGAGVDAAWGALSSIPNVDATAERWAQEEAAASPGGLSSEDVETLRGAGWTTLPHGAWRDPADGMSYDPSITYALARLRAHAARIRAKAEQVPLVDLKAEVRAARDELGAVGGETLAAAAKRVADDLVATRNALDAHVRAKAARRSGYDEPIVCVPAAPEDAAAAGWRATQDAMRDALDRGSLVAADPTSPAWRSASPTGPSNDAAPDPRWSAALEREARALERYKAESARRDAAILRAAAKVVRSEQEARLVLVALGYSDPDAVERVLFGEGQAPRRESEEDARERLRETVTSVPTFSLDALEREQLRAAREAMRTGSPDGAAARHARRELGLTRMELAAILGVTAEAVQQWEDSAEPAPTSAVVGLVGLLEKALGTPGPPIANAWVRGGMREVFATSETPPPGAMRPETLRRIEEAVQAMPRSTAPAWALEASAEAEIEAARRAPTEDEPRHILRAIAYLVRRLELDAPAAEEPR